MKTLIAAVMMTGAALTVGTTAAEAGCIKGAIIGGIAGHMAHHGLAGAAAGCAVGHHMARRRTTVSRTTVVH